MAKVTIENSTANRIAFRTNTGQHLWKIGSNYVLFYRDSDINKIVYRYSADGITWSGDVVLITGSAIGILEVATWYKYVGSTHIIYVVYKEASYTDTNIKIAKFNLNTIASPSQIGSTYDLTASASWTPTYHNRLSMAGDNILWISGETYNTTGSPYHEYYTMKATNSVTEGNDNDINAWGSELLIGDVDDGYDKEKGSYCILVGSRTSSKMLFGYISWSSSTTANLRFRYGDGGNANSNWDTTPLSGEGYLIDSLYYSTIDDYWYDGTGVIKYAPSGNADIVWVGYLDAGSKDYYLRRVDIANQTNFYKVAITGTFIDQFVQLCCYTEGYCDTVAMTCKNSYIVNIYYEFFDDWSNTTALDTISTAYHRFVVMPLWVDDINDMFVIYTEED